MSAARPDSQQPATSATQRRSPDPTRRNAATRRAILDAALDLIVASGFEMLTVEAIARRAGVGKQTIYRWWPSKGAVLLEAFLEHRVEERTETPLLGLLNRGDFAADVRRVLRGTVRAFANTSWEAPYRALTIAIQEDPQLGAEARKRLIRPSLDDVRAWLATAQEHGDVRADIDLDVAVELLVGPVFHRWLLRTGPLSDEYADAVTDAVLHALHT
ncbi:TetR/AcrR family transcriptional regulator [Myxococcus xanthus]|uniref:TetR/AcrR family transcriptional regulator n=1 Tax=Myxococcus xanthus TaxID=34 RepID=UPI00112A7796|nr:TetR/AcrR family transcriptional regulator [Myxococcus xanthus]QDE95984.1 hypothetical protein BHS05_08995 [Myxococcus xanthus]QDF03345.1 hypothetical protein BHS04_09000 [Myxococcus xanthus]